MKIFIIISNGYLKIVQNVEDEMVFQELEVPDNYDPIFVLERAGRLLELFAQGQEHHMFMHTIHRWICWDETKIMQKIYAKLR